MAACGLEPGRRESHIDFAKKSNEHVVISLLRFAVDMIAAIQQINAENFQQIKLRIGTQLLKIVLFSTSD